MKQTLIEIIDSNPEAYSRWPAHIKRMLWCVAEHYMHRDDKKADELIMLLESWVDLDREKVAEIIGWPNPLD